jgi:hypothetical protein
MLPRPVPASEQLPDQPQPGQVGVRVEPHPSRPTGWREESPVLVGPDGQLLDFKDQSSGGLSPLFADEVAVTYR